MTSPAIDPRTKAVAAQVLYLINLLLLPGLAFAAMLLLALSARGSSNALTRCHVRQALRMSIGAGIVIISVPAAIVAFWGLEQPAAWIVGVLYLLSVHATFVLLGVQGLSRAIAGKTYVYPLFGSRTW